MDDFQCCCQHPQYTKYDIKHTPQPLALTKTLSDTIERLLWYVPNIQSKQSYANEFIQNPLYDEFTFRYLLSQIGLSEKDVMVLGAKDRIPQNYTTFFEERLCLRCEKMIFTRSTQDGVPLTKTMSLLRHVRNSIAHGYFTVVNDMFIGFDENPQGSAKTAIIKLNPVTLNNAIKSIQSELYLEKIYAYAFLKLGYRIRPEQVADLSIEKDTKKYLVEIKYIKNRLVRPEHIQKQIAHFRKLSASYTDYTPILILDKNTLTKKAKEVAARANLKVLDIQLIKELLNGNDIL